MRSKFVDLIIERIPPLMTWVIILFPLWGGFFYPDAAAYVILTLNVYFLYRSISVTILLFIVSINIREAESINWLIKLQQLDDINNTIQNLKASKLSLTYSKITTGVYNYKSSTKDFLNKILSKRVPSIIMNFLESFERKKAIKFVDEEISELDMLKKNGLSYNWHEIKHIVIIPNWKEPFHTLESTLIRIQKMNYPLSNISIVLAAEARDPEGVVNCELLKSRYGKYFDNIWVTSHVLDKDHMIGKSSNMYWASKFLESKLKELNWDLKKVTVTSCDADSQLPVDYFSNITYHYVTHKDSEYKYYTGALFLYSNIWKLPFFARVKNSMSTLFSITRLARDDKLIPFSTYTVSMWMISEIGLWTPNVTPEDYHTFFKGLFKYPKKVSTIPIYQKVYADAAEGDNAVDTARNNYLQERRWAWGVSDDGWMLKNMFSTAFRGDLSIRLFYMPLHALWDHLSVGVSILITFGSNLIVLINPRFAYTVVGANLPRISYFLIQVTIAFFVLTVLIDQYLRPAPERKRNIIQKCLDFAEWFLQPVIGIILVVLPGIEAHTRLLFGRYLEYYLTKKK